MRKKAIKFVIGIDEAGRGPLAGPVVVAGIKILASLKFTFDVPSSGRWKVKSLKLRDSKKLSAKKRKEWYRVLTNHPKISWATAAVSPQVIDRINIAQATNLGAQRVYKKLAGDRPIPALLDGSLYLSQNAPHKTIIKGDEKIPAISAASIIAKVTRDRIMARLHKKYPKYGFDAHKGYGTKSHRNAINRLGRLGVHRKSFVFK